MSSLPRKRIPEQERKSVILNNALELFLSKGYRNVTIEQIAKSGGMARTTFYEYFPGKEEILLGLAERVADEVHEVIPEGKTCYEKLEILAEKFLERISINRSVYQIVFQEAQVLSEKVSSKLLSWREKNFAQVAAIAQEGIEAEEIRQGLTISDICFLFQAVVGQKAGELLMSGINVDPHEEAKHLIKLMWSGIGN